MQVSLQRLPHSEGLPLPSYATKDSSGMDLYAAIPDAVEMLLSPGVPAAIPTGICIALPEGYEAQVRPRSGLALHSSVTVLNSPGTIDADYRGEIKVILINHSKNTFTIKRGMKIAQLVIAPVTRVLFQEVESLDATGRGEGGFGSTGV